MTIQELDHKNICILGFGREGKATLRALKTYAPSSTITIVSRNTSINADGFTLKTGDAYLENLSDFDVIIRAPGHPLPDDLLQKMGEKLTNSTQIFFDTAVAGSAMIVGITGSKGKSTTSTLIYEALKAGGKKTHLVGNIGVPMLDYVSEITPDTVFVAELGSFQLEDLTTAPHIAVVTSFFPEHLDRYGSIEKYLKAKYPIAKFQKSDDFIFYNGTQKKCREIADQSPGTKVGFTPDDFPLAVSDTKLRGEHNRSNLAAAYKVALHLGVAPDTALETLRSTPSLPHRLQSLGVHAGVEWVDDSFSTAPDSILMALKTFGERVDTLIAGGVDRQHDFTEVAKYLATAPVQNLILFPDTGAALQQAIEALHPSEPKNYFHTSSMDEAVKIAAKETRQGAICLLSSGAPSFNLFKDFEARGQAFIQAVKALG